MSNLFLYLDGRKQITAQTFLQKHAGPLHEIHNHLSIDLMVEIVFGVLTKLFSVIWTGLITSAGQRSDSKKEQLIRNLVVLQ